MIRRIKKLEKEIQYKGMTTILERWKLLKLFVGTKLICTLAHHRTCTYIEFNAIMNTTIPLKCVALVVSK